MTYATSVRVTTGSGNRARASGDALTDEGIGHHDHASASTTTEMDTAVPDTETPIHAWRIEEREYRRQEERRGRREPVSQQLHLPYPYEGVPRDSFLLRSSSRAVIRGVPLKNAKVSITETSGPIIFHIP